MGGTGFQGERWSPTSDFSAGSLLAVRATAEFAHYCTTTHEHYPRTQCQPQPLKTRT